MPKIKFLPKFESAGAGGDAPAPARKSLPSWYKSFDRFLNEDKKLKIFPSRLTNATIKMCPPFLDAMMTGYTIHLETDLAVTSENGKYGFIWGYSPIDLISEHLQAQIPNEMVPPEYDMQPYKFMSIWGLKLPSGYSALITHPLNRPDLPFYTLSGVVDVDSYHMSVNLPFLLKKDFNGLIPAGTPIAQVIPIKREKWSHGVEEYSFNESLEIEANFLKTLYRSYKKKYWQPKQYT